MKNKAVVVLMLSIFVSGKLIAMLKNSNQTNNTEVRIINNVENEKPYFLRSTNKSCLPPCRLN
jgi:hypothetical protein